VGTAFVGRAAGPEALAALGVNSGLFTFFFLVFNFLATATTPLVATALATGDRPRAGRVVAQALLVGAGLGTALTLVLTLGADPALAAMGASPDADPILFDLAKRYLLIRALAAPAALVQTVGQGAFRGLADMRAPLGVTLGANAVNLALDAALIWGAGWGVEGAAAATTAAEWAAAAAYLALLWRRRADLGWEDGDSADGKTSLAKLAALARGAGEQLGPFARAGGAVAARTALLLGAKTAAAATAARMGAVPVASHQVAMQLWLLSSWVLDALAVAGQALVATSLGRGDARAARAVADRLLVLGVGGGTALALFFTLTEPWIPALFTDDAEVTAGALRVLPLAIGMLPVNAAVYVLDGVFVGAADFGYMAAAMAASAGAAAAALAAAGAADAGLEGVWAALAVLMGARLATLAARYQARGGPVPPQGGGAGNEL
jgi:putative MATE family efflux protein